jgi:hypothetical protein
MRLRYTVTSAFMSGVIVGIAVTSFAQAGQQGNLQPAFGGRFAGMGGGVNPLQSHAMELIQPARTDVRSELHLDIKQKAALDELMYNSQAEIRERTRRQFQSPDLQSIRNLPQDQQRQKLQEFMQNNRAQMMADMQAWQGELTEKVKAILRPGQIKRLAELDLQYRGALALADQKVADPLKLSAEHKSEIAKIVGDFQGAQQEQMQAFFQKMRDSAGTPDQGAQQRARGGFNPQDMQARMQPVLQKIESQKKEAEEKVVALLSPEEKQAWTAALGEKFTFRKDINPNGPRGNF